MSPKNRRLPLRLILVVPFVIQIFGAFEHLFTTKEVGKGTGLGMTIAHQIIVEKHQGSIEINSAPGQGTEFILRIPCSS